MCSDVVHVQDLMTLILDTVDRETALEIGDVRSSCYPSPRLTISHYHLKKIGTFYPETFTETYTEYIHSIIIIVGRSGALVESIAFNRSVVGSTPVLAAT